METLRLPPGPGRLWKQIRTAVRRYLRHHDGRPAYEIGGGTILAARFGHRTSTDIDLTTTDPQKALITMAATGRGLAEAVAGALGVRQSAQEARITTPHGRVDITAMRAMPEGQERYAIVDGEVETVLSTAQILHGKLMRADESPARDVYDIVTAGRLDARSLEEAGRIEGARHLRNTARLWIAQNALITGEARQSITTMDGEPAQHVDDLGIEGARVLDAIAGRLEHDGRPGARLPGD